MARRRQRRAGEEIRRSRSQSVILKRGQNVKYRPSAFTEHGAIMAASVLNSPRAVEMSVYVVRAFVRLRDMARTHAELAKQLGALEHRVTGPPRSSASRRIPPSDRLRPEGAGMRHRLSYFIAADLQELGYGE